MKDVSKMKWFLFMEQGLDYTAGIRLVRRSGPRQVPPRTLPPTYSTQA